MPQKIQPTATGTLCAMYLVNSVYPARQKLEKKRIISTKTHLLVMINFLEWKKV